MRGNPEKIKRLKRLMTVHGDTLADVVRKELGTSLNAFAEKNGFKRAEVSMLLNAHRHRLYPRIRLALAVALEITSGEVDRLIDHYADIRSA